MTSAIVLQLCTPVLSAPSVITGLVPLLPPHHRLAYDESPIATQNTFAEHTMAALPPSTCTRGYTTLLCLSRRSLLPGLSTTGACRRQPSPTGKLIKVSCRPTKCRSRQRGESSTSTPMSRLLCALMHDRKPHLHAQRLCLLSCRPRYISHANVYTHALTINALQIAPALQTDRPSTHQGISAEPCPPLQGFEAST